jgi:hypothetical protein
MKPHLYIHRNLYARGLGFSIVREGRLIFNFWAWHLSGCFYLGERYFAEESHQNKQLREANERAQTALSKVKDALKRNDWLETVAAYETRDAL